MLKGKYILPLFVIALAVILLPNISGISEAAGLTPSYDNANINSGIGIKAFDDPNDGLLKFVKDLLHLMHPIVTILTAVAGLQIAFGISDGKKTVWNWILGIGLALSFGDFVYNSDMFGTIFDKYHDINNTTGATAPALSIKNSAEANADFLSRFYSYYHDDIIMKGATAIEGICIKLLLVLFTINCSMKLALDLISGDKIKFLISEVLKASFYVFLITNWVQGMHLTGLLSDGFQEIGFIAGGDTGGSLKPDAIWANGVKLLVMMMHVIVDRASIFHIADTLLMVIAFIVSCFCIIMTSIEMFMVRIEFLTMSLLTMPLLAFAVIEQFSFLSQKAIGAVFNLALKCCVIAFLQAIIVPFLTSMINQMQDVSIKAGSDGKISGGTYHSIDSATAGGVGESFMVWATLILGLVLIYILVTKIPDLVTGLLNGNPTLGGTSMTGVAMGALGGMATTAGAVSHAFSSSDGGGSGGGGSDGGNGDSKDEGTSLNKLETNATPDPKTAGETASVVATAGTDAPLVVAEEVGKQVLEDKAKGAVKDEVQQAAQTNDQGASPNYSGGTDSSGNGNMPDTSASKDGKPAEDGTTDTPDTTATGSEEASGEDPSQQNATPEGNASANQPDTSTSTSSGSGSFSDKHPNIARAGNVAGNVVGNLAKAALMASPAGNIVRAYQHGKNMTQPLESGSDIDIAEKRHNEVMQAMAQAQAQQAESNRAYQQQLEQVTYLINQRHNDNEHGAK